MAIFKCKMCGASIEVVEGKNICTCEFCGTTQTIHSFDNEKKTTYFKRAEALRFKCEFDKAAGVYETLVSEFPKEAEAYWGLILCKYGIEYVDDPKTALKIPTCHRTRFESIFDDEDYKNVLKYADSVAKDIYIQEANEISKLQKGILDISSKEEPFDIFICYKETDSNGDRTPDSVLAQDIYKELTREGYKVFFSRITLEDKLGSEYEPYIFAALHSARIMIHVTTNSDNSDAIWVRNEWSRYLSLIQEGQKKTLIPCYKGISPYDLPDEMQNLQGQDMSKLGSMQDLIRGINKIIGKNKVEQKVVVASSLSVEQELYEAELRKANVYLSKEMWDDAKESFEKAVKLTEKCGRAYLGLFLVEKRVTSLQELLENESSINLKELDLARSFADESLLKEFDKFETLLENKKHERLLKEFDEILVNNDFGKAENFIISLSQYKDELVPIYRERLYKFLEKETNDKDFTINQLSDLKGYIKKYQDLGSFKDSESRANELTNKMNTIVDSYLKEIAESLKIIYPSEISVDAVNELVSKMKSIENMVFVIPDENINDVKQQSLSEITNYINKTLPSFISSLNDMKICDELYKKIASVNRDGRFNHVKDLLFERFLKLEKDKKKKTFLKTLVIVGSIIATVATVIGVVAGVNAINNTITVAKLKEEMNSILAGNAIVDSSGQTIKYGIYPQTNINDSSLISKLNKSSKLLSNGWYLYDGEYYAKTDASPYQLYSYAFDNGTRIKYGLTYWFKCEPIVWNILNSENGKYSVVSNVLLDTHCYYDSLSNRTIDEETIYPTNYKYSSIRSWLNNVFYNSAFAFGNGYIQTTAVDNSASIDDDDSSNSIYTCDNTFDKIYLLSYQDLHNESYGFIDKNARRCKATDWTRARGSEIYYNRDTPAQYDGSYWTRSPYANNSNIVWSFYSYGYFSRSEYFSVNVDYCSVRPAITLIIDLIFIYI